MPILNPEDFVRSLPRYGGYGVPVRISTPCYYQFSRYFVAAARDLIDHGTTASRFVDRVFGPDDKDSTEPDDVVADGNKELGPEQEKEIGAAFRFLVDAWARPLVNMFEIKEVPEQCQPELAISTTLQDLQDQIQLLKQPMCVANLAEYDRVKLIATLEDFAKLHKYVYYNPGRKPI